MAQIGFDVNGNIKRYSQTEDIAAMVSAFPDPLVTSTISFDETTNQALAKDIFDNLTLYTSSSGVLKKSGVIVTINTASQGFLDSNQLAQLKSILDPTAGAITIAQAKVMFRILFRSLNKAGLL